jgi:hypothetical protein
MRFATTTTPSATEARQLLGTWEMQAAGRTGTNHFDETHPVTVRFTMSKTTDDTAMWKNFGGGDGLVISGAIDNATANVTAADGSCLPALPARRSTARSWWGVRAGDRRGRDL